MREEKSKFCAGQIKCEMPIRHARRDINKRVGYLSPELRRGVRTRDICLKLSAQEWYSGPQDLMDHPGQDWRWRRGKGCLWGLPTFRSSTEGKEIGKEQPVHGDQNQNSFSN